jgi:hypothetical protein
MNIKIGLGVALVAAVVAMIPPSAFGEVRLFITNESQWNRGLLEYSLSTGVYVGGYGQYTSNSYIVDLAYDPYNHILYGSGTNVNVLCKMNLTTGQPAAVGSYGSGVSSMQALAFDPVTRYLYGAYGFTNGDGFYRIDPATGLATLIGHSGHFRADLADSVVGMAFDPVTNELYGVMAAGPRGWGAFVHINKETGAATMIQTWSNPLMGISFNPETGVLFAVSNWGYHGLYTIDKNTGNETLFKESNIENPLGIAFTPEPCTLALLACGGAMVLWRRGRR